MDSMSNEAGVLLDTLPGLLFVVGCILAGWLIRPWWSAVIVAGVWAIITLVFTLLVLATGPCGIVGFDPLAIVIRIMLAAAVCLVVYLIAEWNRRRMRG